MASRLFLGTWISEISSSSFILIAEDNESKSDKTEAFVKVLIRFFIQIIYNNGELLVKSIYKLNLENKRIQI